MGMNFKISAKHIVLAIISIICIVIISFAWIVLNNLFFSTKSDATTMTHDLDSFFVAYEDNSNANDLPPGLNLQSSQCTVNEKDGTFTYQITFKNTDESSHRMEVQVFHGEQYISVFGKGIENPMMSIIGDDYVYIEPGKELTLNYTGLIFGDDTQKFIDNFDDLYLEVIWGYNIGRIKLDVEFKEK